MTLTRRAALSAAVTIAGAAAPAARRARAGTPVRLVLSWFAQAEVGGFYQALARGYYADRGLDVRIAMGGPQVNAMQLLLAGQADFATGYDFQTLRGIAAGMPLLTVAASFQHDQQGLMTHESVTGLAMLRGHPILIAGTAHATFWPWLRARYGFSDAQLGAYTFNLQPFFRDPAMAVQAYASSEPYQAALHGVPVRFFPFAAIGYPPYGTPLLTTRAFAAANDSLTADFVAASLAGWRDYLRAPEIGNALIKKDNPRMTDGQLAFGVRGLAATRAVDGGDAARLGIGAMTEARWQATRDFMVGNALLPATTDWRAAFTTRYVARAKVMPL